MSQADYAVLVGVFVVVFAACGVWAYVRWCRTKHGNKRASRAVTVALAGTLAVLVAAMGVLLYQTLQPAAAPAAAALYTCRYPEPDSDEAVCAGMDKGEYVEFRGGTDHPRLLAGTHDVHWSSPSGSVCGQAHQFVAPLLAAAADELEAHRPRNLADVSAVLSQGEAARLVDACSRSSLNSLLVINVTAVVLTAAAPDGQTDDELDETARNLREQLATGEGTQPPETSMFNFPEE